MRIQNHSITLAAWNCENNTPSNKKTLAAMLIVVDSNNNYMTTYKDTNGYCELALP